MILIKRVHVVGFRSLADVTIEQTGHLHAFVGKNSSGKSNLLRALNLFFNGQVGAGKPLSFVRDVFERPKRRQKKRIEVSVDFDLPPSFHFRKQQAHFAVLGKSFRITRVWELDPRRNVTSRFELSAGGQPIANGDEVASQFLELITFRYIPNRSVPAEILRSESQTLASSVFRRMKDQATATKLMQELNGAASRMLKGATEALESTGAPMTQPSVATGTLSEMLTMSGFQARGQHGRIVQDEDWGAGHQAFFLYQVLHALDTDYSRYFGWRQATVWAVEEPESALHRELETRLATKLRDWARASDSRLQIVVSTHSPVFSMAADSGNWLALDNAETKVSAMAIPELVRAAEREGVSGWTQPVLTHPWNPVVLVEGDIDADVLSHVAGLSGRGHIRFLPVPRLDAAEQGAGKDSIVWYLKRNQQLITHRLAEAPLLVLFDWEVSQQDIAKARNAYGANGPERVLRMDPKVCDPLLGPDFKGIERFYPARLVQEAHAVGKMVVGFSTGQPASVSIAQLKGAKAHLRSQVLSVTSAADLAPLFGVIAQVEKALHACLEPQRKLFETSKES